MTIKVIGAGVGRTGTTSLKLALTRLLGAPCYHMIEVFEHPDHFAVWTAAGRGKLPDWEALLAGYSAAVDWPSSAFWEELAAAYPDAKILLSTRDPDSWWKSVSDTIFSGSTAGMPGPLAEMLDAILSARFVTPASGREAILAAYERHNAHVRKAAPPGRLVEWTARDGWGPLCAMLGVPVPDEPFPHANTTEEFQARRAARINAARE